MKTNCVMAFFLLLLWTPVFGQSREEEQGAEAAKEVEQVIGVYNHPAANYINEIGQRLVLGLDDNTYTYRFYIIDMAEPNAFALPGGYVYFSRGLLLLANSEEELAGVMGHEIIHIADHHARKSQTTNVLASILMVPGMIAGAVAPVAGTLLSAPLTISGGLLSTGYSRGNEKKADKKGVALAAKAGYNPEGLRQILFKMHKEVEIATGREEEFNYFSTHPYTPKRVEYVTREAGKIKYSPKPPFATSHKAFLEKLTGMCIGENPAEGVFTKDKFLHPLLEIAFTTPSGWEKQNTRQMVAFINRGQHAEMAFEMADTARSMQQQADELVNKLFKAYGIRPVKNESVTLGGKPGHQLEYRINTQNGTVMLAAAWVKLNGKVYRVAQISDRVRNDYTVLAASIHRLSNDERNQIEETVLEIAESLEGETLETLSKRTGNVLDLPFLALINNLEQDAVLPAGKWIKIGIRKKYKVAGE